MLNHKRALLRDLMVRAGKKPERHIIEAMPAPVLDRLIRHYSPRTRYVS
jgi:hypothetical protein